MSVMYADLELWQPIVGLPKLEKPKALLEPVHFIFIFVIALLFLTARD